MKKLVILFSFLFLCNTIQAQIQLTTVLVDSVISNLYNFNQPANILNDRAILNFVSYKGQKKTIYVSSTSINWRKDIHENMMIYIHDINVFFVILRNVKVDSGFHSKLIEYSDPRFEKTLDSIKFRKDPYSGVVIMHTPLTVYRIKKRPFCKRTFKITSQNYIPYLSAPDEFIPLKKFAGRGLSTVIEEYYYDYKPIKTLSKQYYEDMKPAEKIILRMPKNK